MAIEYTNIMTVCEDITKNYTKIKTKDFNEKGRFVKLSKDWCGHLRAEHVGQKVCLKGWVSVRRDHGNIVFVDLRDSSGIVQVSFNPEILFSNTCSNLPDTLATNVDCCSFSFSFVHF